MKQITINIFLIGIGGGIGSILRYITALIVNKYYNSNFPLATFLINIAGCFLIGAFMGFFDKGGPTDNYKYLFVTGFCGGYTTFSTFAFENSSLINNGNSLVAFLYVGASVLFGLLFVWLGLLLGRWI